MFQNHLKIAWRNLIRNKAFSAINIVGLAIGLSTCLLIGLFILDELSYDRYNEKADRMVRVVFRASINGQKIREAHVMPPVAQILKANYPEVEAATRLRAAWPSLISYGEKSFPNERFAYVDPNFFQVFTLPLIAGNAKTALAEPNTLIISQSAAEKYFGTENPIGKVLTVKSWNATFTVMGVMQDVPTNSHFHGDFFASLVGVPDANSTSMMTSEYHTYLVLPKGYDYTQLEAKLPKVVATYMGPQLQKAFSMSFSEFLQKGNQIGLFLNPLTSIHLHSDSTQDLEPGGNSQYVYIFGAIAVFMLLIACINFMNLSTAGASKRGKEVGVRKVLGSLRSSLTGQFLTESLLLTAIALVLAFGLVAAALPFFDGLTGKKLSLDLLKMPWLVPAILLLGTLVGLLAGSYPAFFLSSFKPIAVLKGGTSLSWSGKSGIGVRSGLVVLQFFIATLLMVGTTVVYQQLNFIQNTKLGYDKDQVLVLRDAWRLGKNEAVFRQQVEQDSRVANVSVSGYLPAGPTNNNNFISYADNNSSQLITTLRYDIDSRYIPTMGMEMVAGRNFSPQFPTDSMGVILNETAARAYGWAGNALGHTITHAENDGSRMTYRVIGVVKDFHFKSFHERISPLLMVLGKGEGSIIIKAKTKDVSGLLASLTNQWNAFKPEVPFSYTFLDESLMQTYLAEQKTGRVLGLFSGLTIFVACLGLFGLAMFTAEQRRKEIGVRKVLGATVASVVGLLSKDVLKPVLVAIAFASPIAWWAMNNWLADFAYKIDIQWWVFALAGTLAVAVALLTVSFQSVKAALMDPVKSLRSE
ncbi:ABC transporter permease [Fibrella forsythiae]|uniref:ABC transporter permease n=1 Tax=Fibrella forsythiae TaxID=2817061 RepID=A0ABS3JDZ5_9BACT|nr:ABC transporter permease [Fibrella forsythiae]MBO0948231.1 ABC transporter permease [Fibrella forsythiae]